MMSDPQSDLHQLYSDKPADFYAQQLSGKGLRAFWFRKRQEYTYRLICKYYTDTGPIIDIGCGNVLWNRDGRAVIGIDICDAMLTYNIAKKKAFFAVKADFMQGLPFEDNSVSCVVITEVLEHMTESSLVIQEIKRILKPGGILIASVPYGRFPGIWSCLFGAWCSYKWFFCKDRYYKNKCGHCVAFNKRSFRSLFEGFSIMQDLQFAFLTLFLVAQKGDHA